MITRVAATVILAGCLPKKFTPKGVDCGHVDNVFKYRSSPEINIIVLELSDKWGYTGTMIGKRFMNPRIMNWLEGA